MNVDCSSQTILFFFFLEKSQNCRMFFFSIAKCHWNVAKSVRMHTVFFFFKQKCLFFQFKRLCVKGVRFFDVIKSQNRFQFRFSIRSLHKNDFNICIVRWNMPHSSNQTNWHTFRQFYIFNKFCVKRLLSIERTFL